MLRSDSEGMKEDAKICRLISSLVLDKQPMA